MAEETQQPTPAQIRTAPYLSPAHAYGGSIITMTNTEEELNKLELTLKSKQIKGSKLEQNGEPLLNDFGVSRVMGIVRSIVKRDTIMNDFKDKDIPVLIDFLADTLARDLMINRKPYDIGKSKIGNKEYYDPSARDVIFFTALTTAYICLLRGREGGDRRFWKGSQQDIRHVQVMEGQSKGLLSKINPWSKK